MQHGDFIAYLDSDDYVEKDTYELLYKKAKEFDYDMVECDFIWEYPNKKKIDTGIIYSSKKEALAFGRVVAWNKLYKKEIVQNSNVEFPKGLHYEDVEYFYKILLNLNKIGFIKKPIIHYTQRENSISKKQTEKTKDIFYILDNVIKYYKEKGVYEEYKEALEYSYVRLMFCSSLLRIRKIKEKSIKKKLINETWDRVNANFPMWRKNKILKKFSIKNMYIKYVNKILLNIL